MAATTNRKATEADARFPAISKGPGVHSGRPVIIGTGLTVAQVVRTWQDTGGDSRRVAAIHPLLAGRDDLVDQALAYYRNHRDEIDRDLRSTFDNELKQIRARGYDVDADGKIHRVARPPHPVMSPSRA